MPSPGGGGPAASVAYVDGAAMLATGAVRLDWRAYVVTVRTVSLA